MRQGRVYFPATILPPRQATNHRVVILTKNNLLNTLARRPRSFVVVALIRSAVNQSGQPVPLIPVHSIPIAPADANWLTHNSIIETHQLFHVDLTEFQDPRNRHVGDLPANVLAQVLQGAQALFH